MGKLANPINRVHVVRVKWNGMFPLGFLFSQHAYPHYEYDSDTISKCLEHNSNGGECDLMCYTHGNYSEFEWYRNWGFDCLSDVVAMWGSVENFKFVRSSPVEENLCWFNIVSINCRYSFPIDMLRYDRAFLMRECDVANVINSHNYKKTNLDGVLIGAYSLEEDGVNWHIERWKSFGASISKVEDSKEMEQLIK